MQKDIIQVAYNVHFGTPSTNYFNFLIKTCSCGHDCKVVGFTTTCAISAYHH